MRLKEGQLLSLNYLIQGFLFGLAYVAPIGVQNLYVINTAIRKSKLVTLKTALITIFFDITLALACFFGVGVLLQKFIIFKNIILFLGFISILYIGISLIKSVPTEVQETDISESTVKIILRCFVVTWLNPQAIIDGTLLLGGMRASLPDAFSNIFIMGSALASFTWFSLLSTIVCINKDKFNTKILRIINIICGLIILYYGFKLGYNLFSQLL